MIRKGVCKYCSEDLRANGDDKFKAVVDSHFRAKHPQEYQRLFKLKVDAEQELKELREKYPEVYLAYGFFSIDWDKLLSKPQT